MDVDAEFRPGSTWTNGTAALTVVGTALDDGELRAAVWAGGSGCRSSTLCEVMVLMCATKRGS